MKIVTVVGARPQFIKAAAVSTCMRNRTAMAEILVHTGQHYDASLSDVFFRDLGLMPPKYSLGIGGGSHGQMTGRMLEKLDTVLAEERPDAVMVYGDTNSTIAGALAAAKLCIPVAHVEAGLRSFNRAMPEEVNRVLTDHCSDILFCPTPVAVDNLRREGLERGVHLVGDVMYDVALRFGEAAERSSTIVEALGLHRKRYVLVTIHRAENTDEPRRLHCIFDALQTLAAETEIVLPLHPRTRNALAGKRGFPDGLRIIEPVGFFDMLVLERNAAMIATDSGGVQKEAYFCGVPCVTLRRETEWVELLDTGASRLAPPDNVETLLEGLRAGLASPHRAARPGLYGDGTAAERIVDVLARI